jgi:hypothetical protein
MNQPNTFESTPFLTIAAEPLEVIAADLLEDTRGGMSERDACELGVAPGSQAGFMTGAYLGVRGSPLRLAATMTLGTIGGALSGCGLGAAIRNVFSGVRR